MSAPQDYVVLLYGDEAVWESATPEERQEEFGRHDEFSRRCAEGGHEIIGGAELRHSRTARSVRAADDGSPVVTDGPYTELVEQLGGYYVVRTADLDGLTRLVTIILSTGTAEIRPLASPEIGADADATVEAAAGAGAGTGVPS
ncbi:YciI family protein [Cellulomonas carbonis]|uniref:YCII-related domain-containing protein n=1 Tax=Cellulomonas carbonis T26 TaxID=947969 RepID=A0A0A0BUB6_9CELL|nr:YciI family protein [Cellulomonas carbonis]KGM11575.1 hypothetical protein N868_05460 [Cellulomonas carbonis T26]GGC06788.1 hypothetical protein GCM10010972_20050 [Cellulomonas carbonis]